MLLRKIILYIIFNFILHCVKSQSVIKLNYTDIHSKENYVVPNINANDSNKLIILLFIKEAYKIQNAWFKEIEHYDIDTAHLKIFRIDLPQFCGTSRKTKSIQINNYKIYNFPDYETQIKFQIIFIGNETAKNWGVNKVENSNLLFKPLKNEISKSKYKNDLSPTRHLFSTNDSSCKEDFKYLIKKNRTFDQFVNLKIDLKDSILLFNKKFSLLDSIYKSKQKKDVIFNSYFQSNILSNTDKSIPIFFSYKFKINYSWRLDSKLPIKLNLGTGFTILDFKSELISKISVLGFYKDSDGDIYNSEILNFHSKEHTVTNNYCLNFGMNYLPKSKKNKITPLIGIQIGINSKPEIRKNNIYIKEELIEARRYEVLNFDAIQKPISSKVEDKNNFIPYLEYLIPVGLHYQIEKSYQNQIKKFYIAFCINFVSTSNINSHQKSRFEKKDDIIVYNPLIFAVPALKIQSIGFNLSLGYEI
jgi:hypothetical protein